MRRFFAIRDSVASSLLRLNEGVRFVKAAGKSERSCPSTAIPGQVVLSRDAQHRPGCDPGNLERLHRGRTSNYWCYTAGFAATLRLAIR